MTFERSKGKIAGQDSLQALQMGNVDSMTLTDWTLISLLVIVSSSTSVVICLLIYRRGIRSAWKRIESDRRHSSKLFSDLLELLQASLTMTSQAIAPSATKAFRSQHGEDIWVCRYFDGKRDGVYFEAGAYDGLGFSNSSGLELLGWTGILVEPVPNRFEQCKHNRPDAICVNAVLGAKDEDYNVSFWIAEAINGGAMLSSARPDENLKKRWKREGCATREILVPQRSINSLLNEFNIERIDFMSLDLEGGEADVLRGLDFQRHRPKLLCIENAVPDSESFRLLVQEGYRLIRSRHCNYFFEPESKENYGRLQKF